MIAGLTRPAGWAQACVVALLILLLGMASVRLALAGPHEAEIDAEVINPCLIAADKPLWIDELEHQETQLVFLHSALRDDIDPVHELVEGFIAQRDVGIGGGVEAIIPDVAVGVRQHIYDQMLALCIERMTRWWLPKSSSAMLASSCGRCRTTACTVASPTLRSSPARAGIAPSLTGATIRPVRFPRSRGDSP